VLTQVNSYSRYDFKDMFSYLYINILNRNQIKSVPSCISLSISYNYNLKPSVLFGIVL
jgi:hypothetical protein